MRRNAALHRAPDVDDTTGELARREVRSAVPGLNAWARTLSPTGCRRNRREEVHKQHPAQDSSTPTAVGAQSAVRPTTRLRKLHTARLVTQGERTRHATSEHPTIIQGRSAYRPEEWKKKSIHRSTSVDPPANNRHQRLTEIQDHKITSQEV
jgi:hypothetical protein